MISVLTRGGGGGVHVQLRCSLTSPTLRALVEDPKSNSGASGPHSLYARLSKIKNLAVPFLLCNTNPTPDTRIQETKDKRNERS